MYESGGDIAQGSGRTELTDIITPMYPSVGELVALGGDCEDDRPIILCEYSHSMGNSNGNIHLYFEQFWGPNKRIQGKDLFADKWLHPFYCQSDTWYFSVNYPGLRPPPTMFFTNHEADSCGI